MSMNHPLLSVAQWLDVILVADHSGLLLAVLDVAVLLSFLGASLHLELTDLLRLEVAILLLDWKGGDIGELLPIPCISVLHTSAWVLLGIL